MVIAIATSCSLAGGLAGPFLFDDFATLAKLARFGGIDDLQTFLLFLTGDISGAGRPISLLTFLLNTTRWPADPWAFKLTNLTLHLAIGGLLFMFTRQLLRPVMGAPKGYWAALLVAAFWLLNPLNISTVLYVVQRMAMLSALFTLLGLIAYVHGRAMLASHARRGYGWITAAVIIFTPLAVLSKENGALLPLLIMALEYTVLRHASKHVADRAVEAPSYSRLPSRWWSLIFLWMPSLALVAALFHYSGVAAYTARDFTVAERLLTEARVLFEYLWYWLNPFAMPRGVLADDYIVSRGLLEPWTTLPAIMGILGVVAWAMWQRNRYPLAAFAALFFIVGHLMESTVLPLEIYFEHRNYLPAMFLILPGSVWVLENCDKWRTLLLLVVAVLSAQAFQTYRLASVWGDELRLASLWAHRNPNSTRVQDFLASTLAKYGRPDLAVVVLENAMAHKPENSHFYLHHLTQKCLTVGVTESDWARVRTQFAHYPLNVKSYPLLTSLVEQTPSPACRGVTASELQGALEVMAAHPSLQDHPDTIWPLRHLQGELQVKSGQAGTALASFQDAIRLHPDTGVGMQQVALLASHGFFKEALDWLGTVETLPRPQGWRDRLRSLDYDAEIRRIRSHLLEDMQNQQALTKQAP